MEAGLRYAYLQFDGIGNAANSHRYVGNLFDVKLRAIENLHSNGVDIVLVITVVNGINNEQVGRIVRFALDNPDKIRVGVVPAGLLHRPGRSRDGRAALAQRYTLSHLAHDIKDQLHIGDRCATGFRYRF
jgi:7,8-dihydro-6-hydroxymethylpterin dimethyltransferase